MRVLITGGAGFIGSHLVDRLVADGHRTTVIDNLSHGDPTRLAGALASGRCRLIERDITASGLDDIVTGHQVVFHLAAHTDVCRSLAGPVHDASTNVVGTVAVLDAARRAGARKIVFTSSAAIYGPQRRLPVREHARLDPRSPYAVSKITAEYYLRLYGRLYGLEHTTLVLANVYGPRQDPHAETGVVAIFIEALRTRAPAVIYGDGRNTRDYVHVTDVVDALCRAAGRAADGIRLNIGTGTQTTDLQLHQSIARATGSPAPPRFAPPRPGDLRCSALDPSAAHRHLGWRPRTSLTTGITWLITATECSATG